MSINNACLPFCCLCPPPLVPCHLSASCASFNVECCVWFLPRLPSCHSWWHVRQLNDKGCKCELGVGQGEWVNSGRGEEDCHKMSAMRQWLLQRAELFVLSLLLFTLNNSNNNNNGEQPLQQPLKNLSIMSIK